MRAGSATQRAARASRLATEPRTDWQSAPSGAAGITPEMLVADSKQDAVLESIRGSEVNRGDR